MKNNPMPSRRLLRIYGSVAILLMLAIWFLTRSSGIFTAILLTGILMLCILLVRMLHIQLAHLLFHRHVTGSVYMNILITITAIMIVITGGEIILTVLQHVSRPDISRQQFPPTMPAEWARRTTQVDGARVAWYWHSHLHVFDQNGMRRTTPFPPKDPARCRILVVGDSLTYGYGIAEEDTYARRIEADLTIRYQIDVLNLGIPNLQSADILSVITFFTPELEPELILYGVCLNDFLNSGELEGTHAQMQKWSIPLPKAWKNFLINRTLTGAFLTKRYNDLLLSLGVRVDFFANILENFQDYQTRFAHDVAAMNAFVTDQGRPPVVALVLNQFPATTGRGSEITAIAEQAMHAAGMTVIPSAAYYQTYNGRALVVSPWEGHPSAEANQIFADAFLQKLRQHPALQRCLAEHAEQPGAVQ